MFFVIVGFLSKDQKQLLNNLQEFNVNILRKIKVELIGIL
jgi:hypothetical protein